MLEIVCFLFKVSSDFLLKLKEIHAILILRNNLIVPLNKKCRINYEFNLHSCNLIYVLVEVMLLF